MKHSTCYLSFDFSKHSLPKDVLICPESLKNGTQIKEWVNELKESPKNFATTSLYLLRELYLQKINVLYINITENGLRESTREDEIGNIEILDRDLEQSERYMDFEMDLR